MQRQGTQGATEEKRTSLTTAPAQTAALYNPVTSKGPLRARSFALQIQNLANFSAWGTWDSTAETSSAWTPYKKDKVPEKGVNCKGQRYAPGELSMRNRSPSAL